MALDYFLRVQTYLGLTPSQGGDIWNSARWDQDRWAGSSVDWIEITPWTLDVQYKVGVQRFDDLIRPATFLIRLDNQGGRFNPDHGADSLPGDLKLRPGRLLRIRTRVYRSNDSEQVGSYDIYNLYIDTLDEIYSDGGADSTMIITGFDQLGLAAYDRNPPIAPVGAGELSSARVDRILDLMGVQNQWRAIDTGEHTVQATDLSKPYSQELQDAARAEGGAYYIEKGVHRFRPFSWLTTDPRSVTPQMRPGSGIAGEPAVVAVDAIWTGQQIRNDVQLIKEGETTPYRVQGLSSQGIYGRRSFQRSGYINDVDLELEAIADRTLASYEWDYQRINYVDLWAPERQAMVKLTGTQIGDLVRLTVNMGLRGWSYTVDAHVLGIEWIHRYSPNPDTPAGQPESGGISADWICRLRLDQSQRGAPGDVREHDDSYDAGYL